MQYKCYFFITFLNYCKINYKFCIRDFVSSGKSLSALILILFLLQIMSYNRKKCVVLGCKSETLRLRSFPTAKDKDRFLKWLRACGNTELLQLSVPQLRHRVVCDKHFEARVKLATTLSRVAVPTLHLPSVYI